MKTGARGAHFELPEMCCLQDSRPAAAPSSRWEDQQQNGERNEEEDKADSEHDEEPAVPREESTTPLSAFVVHRHSA
jgi:hypothetical protein